MFKIYTGNTEVSVAVQKKLDAHGYCWRYSKGIHDHYSGWIVIHDDKTLMQYTGYKDGCDDPATELTLHDIFHNTDKWAAKPTEMTMKDLSKLLGYEVKIVK